MNSSFIKMVVVQTINDQDTVNQKTVCAVLLNALAIDDHKHLLMTDEANFHLCGNVNSQNCRNWATENPRNIHQKPLYSENFIVWCGVASFGVIGPYFFEDEAGRAVTVNSAPILRCFSHFWKQSCRDLVLKTRLLGFSKTGQQLTLRELRSESSTRCSQLAWSHEDRILIGLQDRPISTSATSYSGDSSRASCRKINQGQRLAWNRTSETKWQQFLPPSCNEWCRISRNACGNVWTTRDTTSQTLYSGSENCNWNALR
jgi:hypothetical protein